MIRRTTLRRERAIDVGERFASQNLASEPDKAISIPTVFRSVPSITRERTISRPAPAIVRVQPPDYTAFSTGAPKPGIIAQDGLAKRLIDVVSVRKIAGPNVMRLPPLSKARVAAVAKRALPRQKVVSEGRRVIPRTADFTDFAGGANKKGIVSQEGLAKRNIDSAVLKTQGTTGGNVGFLAAVDRFFVWVNGMFGG